MVPDPKHPTVVMTPGVCGGKPRIDRLRFKVQHVAVEHEAGLTPQQIVEAHPILTLAQVHAALAYYFDHQAEIKADVEEDDRFAEEFRRLHPASVR